MSLGINFGILSSLDAADAGIITDGLVLYVDAGNTDSYPESGTTWTDISTNSNNGTLTNGPTFDSGDGGSIVFDGTDDYVNFGNILNIGTGDASLTGWVKRTGGNGNQEWIFSKAIAAGEVGRYALDFASTTKLRVIAAWSGGHTNYYYTGTFSADVWYNYAVVFDRDDSLYLYLNGALNATHDISTHSSVNMTNTRPYRLGSYTAGNGTSPAYFLDGNIALHAHYNRVLSDEEVLQNYNATKARYGL